MTVATLITIGAPRAMTIWIKLGLGASAIVAGWWGVASFDYERYLSPTIVTEWLRDAGPLAPLLLIGSMACAVIIPPIPGLPLDLAAGAAFGPFFGTVYAVLGAEIGAIGAFLIARAIGREALSRYLKADAVFCQLCTDHQLMGLMFFARLIPVFSFDVVSYGAGLTNIYFAENLCVGDAVRDDSTDLRLYLPGQQRGLGPIAADRGRHSDGCVLSADAQVARTASS